MTKLNNLNLYNNNSNSLPQSFKQLVNLRIVSLEYNKFQIFPYELLNLAITELDISHNSIETIPNTIAQMKSLELLMLSVNNLSSIPGSFSDLNALKY